MSEPEGAPGARPGRKRSGGEAAESGKASVTRRGGVGSRREARERALALLYEAEAKQVEPSDVLAELPLEAEPFAFELVEGVGKNRAELDGLIEKYARDWSLDRMPAIDRALMRLAVFELTHRLEIPTGVVISEAVELAKQYSTEESGKFVNGMLSAIAAAVRPSATSP